MSDLKSLLPDTEKVLQKLAKAPFLADFTFVGGSALAQYLKHRYSEDIDLFTWLPELDVESINNQIQILSFDQVQIVNLTKNQADYFLDDVKVTFFANNWSELKNKSQLIDNLSIADIEVLAIMKVNTLFLRAKFRDYYDLYVLNKEKYTLQELYEFANKKIPNLNISLFQRALTFTGDIQEENIDLLQPKYKLTIKQIENHFIEAVKEWNKSLTL